MYNLISIFAVLLPLVALILIPIWLKKKGKGKNAFLRILLGIAGAIILAILMSSLASACMPDELKIAQREKDSIRESERLEKKRIKDSIAAEKARISDSIKAEREKPIKSEWIERTATDEMTDATTVWMTLTSDNYFDLAFPYNGGSRLKISVRYRKQDGNQVMLSINRGQLLSSNYNGGNKVVVRFDDDAAMTFSTTEPSDYSSDVLFLSNPRKFINRAKTAKLIKIQVPVFDNGQPIFIFEPAEPLKWEK